MDQEKFLQWLKDLGFDVLMMGGRCPYQIEANHATGLSVYFRSRGQSASLDVYGVPQAYMDLPGDEHIIWSGHFRCWEEYAAGWIDDNEAWYAFSRLWADAKDLVME